MPAVQHADDHFLSNVAALRERDGALLDSCFERNRVRGHVHAEERIPRLDARGLEGSGIGRRGPCRVQTLEQRRSLSRRHVHAEAGDAELVHAGDDCWRAIELGAGVPIVDPFR